ncbi:hypothetical protein B0H10DRAFT_2185991 [Mycena sp. CBHHK59/15]|nr:hypothetical protein B0H10DRAFT_2185991 [Mycena sp. CBHHK59/15]
MEGREVFCVCVWGLAVPADLVLFGKAAAKSGSEKDGTRDGQTRSRGSCRKETQSYPSPKEKVSVYGTALPCLPLRPTRELVSPELPIGATNCISDRLSNIKTSTRVEKEQQNFKKLKKCNIRRWITIFKETNKTGSKKG